MSDDSVKHRPNLSGLIKVGDDGITSLSYSNDGQFLASGRDREYVTQIWDTRTGLSAGRYKGHKRGQVAFSPDGTVLASGGLYGPVRLYDTATRGTIGELSDSWPAFSLGFTPDGRSLGIAHADMPIDIFDTESLLLVRQISDVAGPAVSLAFGPSDYHLAVAELGCGFVHVYCRDRVGSVVTFDPQHGSTCGVAFTQDGTTIGTCGADGTVRLWSTTSWEIQAEIEHGASVLSVAFSPDSTAFATGDCHGTIRLWLRSRPD